MTTNGTATLKYKPVAFSTEILPDMPEDEWLVTVLPGKSEIKPSKAGDPMMVFTLRFDEAVNSENESYQGTQKEIYMVIFSDRDAKGVKANKFAKPRLIAFASQAGVDINLIPKELTNPDEDLKAFVEACEGQQLRAWTVHTNDRRTPGLKSVNVEFTMPGGYHGGGGRDE